MKPLLRKIFFWDEPAQGAMFGLTLLPVSVWLVFSVLCGILEFDYRLVQKGPVPALLITALFAVGAYCGILGNPCRGAEKGKSTNPCHQKDK